MTIKQFNIIVKMAIQFIILLLKTKFKDLICLLLIYNLILKFVVFYSKANFYLINPLKII